MEGKILHFPKIHVRTSAGSRAAKAAIASAVSPDDLAIGADKIGCHHSAGMRSRCHHLRTADVPAPISLAMASVDGHKPMIERNEVQSPSINSPIGQLVLKRKAKLSADCEGQCVLKFLMPSEAKSAYRLKFLARTREAREYAGFSQARLAALLEDGMGQDKYKTYESRTCLPHEYIDRFCAVCGVSLLWLMTGEGQMRRSPTFGDEIPAPQTAIRRRKAKVA